MIAPLEFEVALSVTGELLMEASESAKEMLGVPCVMVRPPVPAAAS